MSTLHTKLDQIDSLRRSIEARGKLPDEVLRRIEYRFRLECNYYSNRMEGGTLTRQETRGVMARVIIGSMDHKPIKDVEEMKGHDNVMTQILRIGRGELRLSEKRIQEMHKEIIVEENPEFQAQLGKWKKGYNKIINSRGEVYDFLPPDEVPEAMHALLNWLNAELDKIDRGHKEAVHPAVLASDFQVRYLTIHPFYDGNGRTGRLLSNLILVANGLPPFYITDEEKDVYNLHLEEIQGYGSGPDLFHEFMAGLVLRSLQLVVDVAEGRDTDEAEEWSKKLRLLKTTLPVDPVPQISRSVNAIRKAAENSIFPLLDTLVERLKEFDELFRERQFRFGKDMLDKQANTIEEIKIIFLKAPFDRAFTFRYELKGFVRTNFTPFSIGASLGWTFEEYTFNLNPVWGKDLNKIKRYYDQPYTLEEIKRITALAGDNMVQQIEENLKKSHN